MSGSASQENHSIPGYSLSLLGTFSLRKAGNEIPLTGSSQRVLAYIALYGVTNRKVLAGRLWPEAGETRARASLRNALWAVGARAPALIGESQSVVQLAPIVKVDVDRFHGTVREVCNGLRPIHEISVEDVLRNRELLPGMYDDWLEFEKEKYRQLRLHALEAASASLLDAGAFAAALEAAYAAVAVEPLRETANAAVISVHLRENNLIEAMRHYEHFRRQIAAELGVAPSPSLQALLPRQCRNFRSD